MHMLEVNDMLGQEWTLQVYIRMLLEPHGMNNYKTLSATLYTFTC